MAGEIEFLHHVGMFPEDSEVAFTAYERLGFVLTPLSIYRGAAKPGEPVKLLGSANRCAVVDGSYLEITARVGAPEDAPEAFRRRTQYLERYEGLHIICLGAEDVRAVEARISKAGFEANGVVPLERDVETPEGTRTAMFERVRLVVDEGEGPREHVQVANHLTPQYIFQKEYMTHPNGATAMTEVIFCVADPDMYESKYQRLTGRKAEREGVQRVIRLPRSRISIVGGDELSDVIPGAVAPFLPYMAGFAMATGDLGKTVSLFEDRGVPFERVAGRIMIPATAASGATVFFEAGL